MPVAELDQTSEHTDTADPNPTPATPAPLEPRYPQRNRQPPIYLKDYDQSDDTDSVNHAT